ncbi:MAG: dienelactone hydrolase [Caulobacteraceae bacterium]|nr:dienelactone hydrolase [Caulobacteraceae bacterium]
MSAHLPKRPILTASASLAAILSAAVTLTGTVAVARAPAAPPVQAEATVPAARSATVTIREDGLVADYFAVPTTAATRASAGAVIVLGGSEGGLGGSRALARRLADEGFAAIAVSYFGEPGQSPKLDQVPIEPVGRAVDWLQARPEISGPIAVMGISKGAELALLTASRDPEIRAVVLGVPSSVVWAGIDPTGGPVGSSWTSGGQPLPYVPYDMSKGFTGILNLYNDSLDVAPADARIAVETINGPVLMISGQVDGLWPSARMANEIEQRLKDHRFAYPVINIIYPDAGHAAFGAILPADSPALGQATYFGGTVPGLLAARADGWPRVLDFLRTALKP